MSPSTPLAMLIRQLRTQERLTQEAFGRRIGVGKATVSAYEAGKINPSDATLEKLAREFGLSIDTLRDELSGQAQPGTEFLVSPPPPRPVAVRAYRRLPLAARATFAESFANDHDFTFYETADVVAAPNDPPPPTGLVVPINGDSMEPQLRAGMEVLVEEVPAVDGWRLARPGVYVVVYRNHLVIKRIKENTLAQTGDVWLHSDNPDGGRELVQMDDLRGMWRVVRIVSAPVH